MFFGQWPMRVDPKNRLTMPAEFRQEFGEKVLIPVKIKKREILVYKLEKAKGLPAKKMRLYFSLTIDAQGRILLPTKTCEAVFRDCKDVVWEGWGKYCKIISKK